MPNSILFCTFWYPTIFHQELKRLYPSDKELSAVISDGSEITYELKIKLDDRENLIIESILKGESEDGKSESNFTLELTRTDYHRSGFVQYSFDKGIIPEECFEKFKIILVKDIYHLAKEFYHQHEVDSGKDGALRGVITFKEGGIDGDDNEFLISFLRNFAPVFENYAKTISDTNSLVQNNEKLIRSIEESEKKSTRNSKVLGSQRAIMNMALIINQLCENACVEYTYCKTLLSSIHNKSFTHTLKIDEIGDPNVKEEKKEWRRCALNIRNSMRYIENIKYKNQNRLNKLAQYLLEDVNAVTKEVKSSTEKINLALEQGKRSEKINLILACLSIYISLALGFPLSRIFALDSIQLFPLGRDMEIVIYIFEFLIFLIFLGLLITLLCKKDKVPIVHE